MKLKGPQPVPDPEITCRSSKTCINSGDFKACTTSDGSRCEVYKEEEPIKIPFGKRVTVSAELRRRWKQKALPNKRQQSGYKYWFTEEMKSPRKGIFLGYRHLRDGYIRKSFDEGDEFVMDKQHKAALVCLSERENPIYVPLDHIK